MKTNLIHLHPVVVDPALPSFKIEDAVQKYCNLIRKCKLKNGIHYGFVVDNTAEKDDIVALVNSWLLDMINRALSHSMQFEGLNTIAYLGEYDDIAYDSITIRNEFYHVGINSLYKSEIYENIYSFGNILMYNNTRQKIRTLDDIGFVVHPFIMDNRELKTKYGCKPIIY